ncbi:MAG: hypothetical protein ACD_58C00241G0003 [uncultured bacterium]|nr:MAG: hypothetical protein ACD_58C00241G0003 [uncultured bacterium]
MKDFTLIIYALPGGGKGTQGKYLRDKYNANYLSSGDIIRKLKEESSPLGKEIKNRYNKGIPQPDKVIMEIFGNSIKKLVTDTANKKFVIDGFPKTANQAEFLDKLSAQLNMANPIFIYLDVDASSVIKRISSRLFCHECGASYLPLQNEFVEKKCFKCNGLLQIRDDDKPEVVKTRILEEKKRIKTLLEYYKKTNRLLIIDGKPAITKVNQLIIDSLRKNGIIND